MGWIAADTEAGSDQALEASAVAKTSFPRGRFQGASAKSFKSRGQRECGRGHLSLTRWSRP